MLRTRARLAAVTCAVGLTATFGLHSPEASAASGGRWSRTIADDVIAPFQLAINHQAIFAGDGFTGKITRYAANGSKTVLADTGGEVTGIDVSPDGRTYAYTGSDAGGAYLRIVGPSGSRRVDLGAYEANVNPDGNVTYGVIAGGNPCADAVFGQLTGGAATYTGVVDSHPYAVAWLSDGSWAVADAGGNDILRVTGDGQISTLAVLPRQPIVVTAEMASGLGLPDCTIGVTYAFEPVPTDVESARGSLWVSTLPGGPEDASLGARGKVYQVNRWTGTSSQVASGFLGATNLAVRENGTIFVAELFAGKVTGLRGQNRWTAYSGGAALSVEVQGSSLYVGTMGNIDFETGDVLAPGSIQRIKR